jgi:2-oxoglutarate dehydrogenase E2 component (dihydrolipoamide succinyltransferase)
MTTGIRVPMLEAADGKLSVGRWFKRPGDPVTSGESLVEIDAGNVTHEIQAPITGVLSDILVKDGGLVEVGTSLGIIRQF